MNARDAILSRVRAALAGRPPDGAEPSRGYRDAAAPDDLSGLFAARVADYRASVIRCGSADVEAQIAKAVAGRAIVVPPGLPWAVAGAVPDAGQTAPELDQLDGVVTTATVAIAATGTIVLDHGEGQGRRVLTLIPDLHVCVVRDDQIVADVSEAVAGLDPHRPQTWISGPSATSDIELNRVEGVHGPRNLVVILTA